MPAPPKEKAMMLTMTKRMSAWFGSASFLFLIFAVVLASVVGGALGLGLLLPAFALVCLAIYLPMALRYVNSELPTAVFFWLFTILLVGLPFFRKFTGIDFFFLIELSVLAVVPIAMFRFLDVWRHAQGWKAFCVALVIFVLFSIIGSWFGRSGGVPAVYQLLTNLKMFFMILVGYAIYLDERNSRYFWRLVEWFWLPNAILVIWQWVDFSSYLSFFSGSTTGGPDPLGLLPSRGMGVFHHPTILGAAMGFFFVCASARFMLERPKNYLPLAVSYLLLLLASGQRQETLAVLLVVLAMSGLVNGWGRLLKLGAVLSIGTVTLLVVIWPEIESQVMRELDFWGANQYKRIEQPRQILYLTSVEIANRYFPFGSGLGTFGGAGSVKFDMSFYRDLGFASFSWFSQREFLMDTYWPNFIAESGWIGFSLMLLSVLLIVRLAWLGVIESRTLDARAFALIAFGGVLFVLLLSPTSPAFQDPSLFLLPALFLGIAYNADAYGVERRLKGESDM